MANRDDRNNIKDERIEDVTLYGEAVPSTFQWMTLDRQKNIAHHLEEVTEELTPEEKVKGKKDKKVSG